MSPTGQIVREWSHVSVLWQLMTTPPFDRQLQAPPPYVTTTAGQLIQRRAEGRKTYLQSVFPAKTSLLCLLLLRTRRFRFSRFFRAQGACSDYLTVRYYRRSRRWVRKRHSQPNTPSLLCFLLNRCQTFPPKDLFQLSSAPMSDKRQSVSCRQPAVAFTLTRMFAS